MTYIKGLFLPTKIKLSNGSEVTSPFPKGTYILIGIIFLSIVSINITDFKFSTIIKRGNEFFVILKNMLPPDIGYINDIKGPLLDTIKMSFLGSFIGAVLALPIAVISSSNINHSKVLLNITRFIMSIIRTFPTLIIALIATYIFDIGTFAGTLAIAIFTLGIVCKMLYEQIETADMAPFEAMESLGIGKVRSFIVSIMPQILPTYFSIVLYSFEINVRYAAILGYVGAGGIGLLLDEKFGWREYDKVGMIMVMLFITVIVIESLSRYLRRRLI